jgi:hypothetical protein
MNDPLAGKKTYRLIVRLKSHPHSITQEARLCKATLRAGSREEACREIVHIQMSRGNVVQSISDAVDQ